MIEAKDEKISVRIYSKLTGIGYYFNTYYPLPEQERLRVLNLMCVYDGLDIQLGWNYWGTF